MTPFGKGPEGGPKGPKNSSEDFKNKVWEESKKEADEAYVREKFSKKTKIEREKASLELKEKGESEAGHKTSGKGKTEFAREYYEKKERGFERGKNVKMKISFCRHEEPGKTPEGMSADFLTEQGIQKAAARGKEIPHKYIMAVGSKAVERARQTGALELESATDPESMASAVNVKMTPQLEKMGHKKFAKGEYLIYRHGDLNPVKGLKDMWLEGGKKASEAVEKGEIPADKKENYQYDYYLNNPDRAKELGAQTPREVAQEMVHRASQCLSMSGRIYEGIDLNVRNYSHGPRLEAMLKFVLRQPDGKLGFDNVAEIGGAFKPGENFNLDVQRDEKGELKPVKILRGEKELGMLDLEALAKLVEEYKNHKEKTKKMDVVI